MTLLVRFLAFSARAGTMLLAGSILGGIAIPPLAHALRPALAAAVIGLTTLILLRVDIEAAFRHLRRPGRLAAIVAIQMLVCPVAAWAVVRMLPLDPGLAGAVVLFAAGATITSAPAFARLVGLDAELALLGALLSTLLVPFTAPPVGEWLADVDLDLSLAGFTARLLFVVGLPLAISLLIRRLAGPERLDPLGPALDGATVWILVVFGFAVMDGVGAKLVADPGWILGATSIAALAVAGCNLLSACVALPFGGSVAATAGMLSGFRNMALFLAILPPGADPHVALFFGLYQIPLYLAPLVMKPLYRRLA